MNRRELLKSTLGGAAIVGAAGVIPSYASSILKDNYDSSENQYTLPSLDYAYDALEPHIDAQTMEIHHSRHHQGYVTGLNNAMAKLKEARENDDFSLIKHWSREITFHGGGHFLHAMFWKVMGPDGGGEPSDTGLRNAINRSFGSFDGFKRHFTAASNAVEGSGWGMLSYEPNSGDLVISQVEKQHYLSQWFSKPILGVDVWEHAYYLNYQNRRGAYVDAFFNVINWDAVAELYDAAASA